MDYNSNDIDQLNEMVRIFRDAYTKFEIFNYINAISNDTFCTSFQIALKHVILQTLFRNSILEVHSLFFDNSNKKSTTALYHKFKKNVFSGTEINTKIKKITKDLETCDKWLTRYRNNALAHKSLLVELEKPTNQYAVTTIHFTKLMHLARDCIQMMSQNINPNQPQCYDWFITGIIDRKKAIKAFFEVLAQ